jgi:putative inorganic carbon (HCO3(-)) transporter
MTNKSFVIPKNYFSLLFIAGFILTINYAVLKMNDGMLSACFSFIGIAIVFYCIAFAKNALFPAIIFLVPLSFAYKSGGGVSVDFPAELLIGLLAIIYVIRSISKPTISKKILFHPITILLFSELAWMIIASTTSSMPLVSFKRCLVRFSFLLVFYIIAAHWFSNPQKRKWLVLLYAIGLVIPIIYTLSVHATFGFSKETAYAMPQPFYAEHTVYGAALAFILPALFILFFNRKTFNIKGIYAFGILLLLLLVLAGEIFSFSRAAWLSLVAALLFYFLVKIHVRTWMIILMLGTISFTVFIFRQQLIESVRQNEAVSSKGSLVEHVESVTNLQTDASNLERINRWMCAIRMSEEKPLLGFGPGMYQFEYGRFQVRAEMTHISTFRGNRGHAHSEFFNALSETGFPGLILVLVIMFTIISYGLGVIYKAANQIDRVIALSALLGLVTFYFHGFFNAFMDTDKIVSLVFGAIAMIVIIDLQQKGKNKQVQNVAEEIIQ